MIERKRTLVIHEAGANRIGNRDVRLIPLPLAHFRIFLPPLPNYPLDILVRVGR